jgi:hypothetical protein
LPPVLSFKFESRADSGELVAAPSPRVTPL